MSAGSKIERRERALAEIDIMPDDLRSCVHEFGYPIVDACRQAGVRQPNRIRQLVLQIWAGARAPYEVSGPEGTLDWVLAQAGANISAARLERVLAAYDLRIIPVTPTREMLDASMAEVSDFTQKITKREKHLRRLRAAISACRFRFRYLAEKAA